MVILLLPLFVPVLLIAGWLTALRCHGVPRSVLFGCCAALPVLCVVVGTILGNAEDRQQPPGCRDGTAAGLECGFGVGHFAGYLAAVTGTATLALLAVVSFIVWKVRSSSYRGLPALSSDLQGTVRGPSPRHDQVH
ncbi:hypothetical protein COUCH_11195 [Couchioplanes caeruleus]|uniref:hypothetical protein n=1 Tax=Couchioplanes caeruleus TaxID=56438 RepID=UPI0020BE7C36|nr:hypothetical protein [Couchioplanes caeruleus]UQU66789.1 hypothetical protein COUCH_11195 [Couchioplanes caeruleus]